MTNVQDRLKQLPSVNSQRELEAKIESLQLQLQQAERETQDYKRRCAEAETKERSAVLHQSTLAKAKNELENEKLRLVNQLDNEKRQRMQVESRLINDKKVRLGRD